MAQAFMSDGGEVAICDIDTRALEEFAEAHPRALAVRADVASETDMDAFFDRVESIWRDGPDILCANAGTSGPTGGIDTLDFADWRACIGVNLHGAFLAARRAARTMKARGEGLILFTSSTAGLLGYPNRTPYASAKWALVGLMKSLAMELGPAGIRVNALCPGAIIGERMERVIEKEAAVRGIPVDQARKTYVEGVSLRTMITPEEIAAMALYLASPEGRNISGQAISIDGHTQTLSL
jgi:NAD(P)-dependent dehydrogenase (short-subunit alcohol dehydrogenase family)